jgi:thiol-disulfide isomerase/thioredoxin
MTSGLIALVAALLVATAAGAVLRQRSGKVHTVSRTPRGTSSPAQTPVPGADPGAASSEALSSEALSSEALSSDALTPEVLGTGLGERATLVQFSTELCAYCGPTRAVLGEIASSADGVRVVEIDAAERMDLTKRLRVFTTPTVLVLGPDGRIAARSSGRPRKAELAQTVQGVLSGGVR